jgi:hypothetical protein
MLPVQEFRQTCLLLAANNCAAINAHGGQPAIRHSVMLVVYLLAAFALRRRGLGRRDLRPSRTTVSPSFAPLAAMRAPFPLMARLVGGERTKSPIKGRLAIAYR